VLLEAGVYYMRNEPLTLSFVIGRSQHLLVDIKGIEADFLDSEKRLAKAMTDTVEATGLTMLSYHCHALVPKGVSCVGILLESHISFHTWPDEGVITLDLFTCGPNPLIFAVEIIKELFGIEKVGEDIYVQWSHELRGFRTNDAEKDSNNTNIIDHNSDLSQMIWSPIDYTHKEQIVTTATKYQRVDIWDIVGKEDTPSHKEATKANLKPGDPRWANNDLVGPFRHLFLDGALQSVSEGYIEYHEALVHPGMFSHPTPQHVAISKLIVFSHIYIYICCYVLYFLMCTHFFVFATQSGVLRELPYGKC
jgi:S-adenosylmethionine decarboxylase proenzyme